eukprot:g1101.t1
MKVRKIVKVSRSHGGDCDCRCDRGQERDSQDFKIISSVGSGFSYFQVVRGVLQIIGLFPRCGVQGEINLHFDTYSLVRLLLPRSTSIIVDCPYAIDNRSKLTVSSSSSLPLLSH